MHNYNNYLQMNAK
jgi:hypothetical protein